MKDIKSLYLAARNGSTLAIKSYTEGVNELLSFPNDYLANSEYIINSEIGLSTLNEFVDKYGLSIPVYNSILEQVESCISKCEKANKNSAKYQEAKKYLESYYDRYKTCFDMYEFYSNDIDIKFDPKMYTESYYSFNEKNVQNNRLVGIIKRFGESAIPDMLITASKLGSKALNSVFSYLESKYTSSDDSMMYQWITECINDTGIQKYVTESTSLENIRKNSPSYIYNQMVERNDRVFKESMVLGNENALMDYTAEEVQAIDDLITFKEYQMICCESPAAAVQLQKEIYSLYEEYDGMRMNEFFESKQDKDKKKAIKKCFKNLKDISTISRRTIRSCIIDEFHEANHGRGVFSQIPRPSVSTMFGDKHGKFYGLFGNRTKTAEILFREYKDKTSQVLSNLFLYVDFVVTTHNPLTRETKETICSIMNDAINEAYKRLRDESTLGFRKSDNVKLEMQDFNKESDKRGNIKGKAPKKDEKGDEYKTEYYDSNTYYTTTWTIKLPLSKESVFYDVDLSQFININEAVSFAESHVTSELSIYMPESVEDDYHDPHTLMCESLTEMIQQSVFTEGEESRFKYAYKAAYDFDTGHSLKITYSLDKAIVTDVGVAKPLHDELIDAVNSVKEIMTDDSKFKVPRALATSLNRLFHMKGNIKIRKNSIVQFLNDYIDEIGYVDFQAKNAEILSIYDRVDKTELQGPINIVGIYAANDINKNKNLALSEYELRQMQDKVKAKSSRFTISSISVGDTQTTPTFMTTYWDPNADKNLVNGNGEVISNDNMDRDNITNIISAKEIHGYGSGIENKRYSDALGDFIDPIHDIAHAKRHRMYKNFNAERAQRSIDKESRLIKNMQVLYQALNDKAADPEIDPSIKGEIQSAIDELGSIIKNEKAVYQTAKSLIKKDDYEGVYNTLKDAYNGDSIEKFKSLLNDYSSKFNLSNVKYSEEVATSVLPMLPGAVGESTWLMNTHDKKTGGVPSYIGNNHDMARYGEDDGISSDDDEDDRKTLEDFRRPSATKADSKPESDPGDDERDDQEYNDVMSPLEDSDGKSETQSNEKEREQRQQQAITNYYYNYYNSLNKNTSHDDHSIHNTRTDSHNVDDHSIKNIRTDDHSTDKITNSDDHSSSKRTDSDNIRNSSHVNEERDGKPENKPEEDAVAEAVSLESFDNYNESDDPEKPKSDHPVRETLQDIDRATTKVQQKAKKAVQNVQQTGRAFVKPVKRTQQWINNMISTWKDADETMIKEKLADPYARKNIFTAAGEAIKQGSLLKAGILLNPVFLFFSVTKKIGNHKREGRIRNEMIAELKTEMEIVKEKQKDAEYNHDYKAKYQLMRFENELRKKMSRVAGIRNW